MLPMSAYILLSFREQLLSLSFPALSCGSCRAIHRVRADEWQATPDLHVCGRRNGRVLLPVALNWDACDQEWARSFV